MNVLHNFLFNEALNKKAPGAAEAISIKNIRNTDMTNVLNSSGNVNSDLTATLKPLLENHANKMGIATTDVDHIEQLIKSKNLAKARIVMNNLKSVASIINERINVTDNYLASLEV